MVDVSHDDASLVGQQNRISVDIEDIREQIECCRDDFAWKELPMTAKIRVLLQERIAQLQAEKQTKKSDSSSLDK